MTREQWPLKVLLWIAISGAIASILWLALLRFGPARWVHPQKFALSELMIQEAESFRTLHNRIPSEQEFAVAMQKHNWKASEQCPCYQVWSESEYFVSFGYQSVGTSMVYSSVQQSWEKRE